MNIAMWMLAGGLIGWAAYTYLAYNEERGVKISIAIGAAGGFLGGKMIAPMFTAAEAVPADFSASALIFAAGVAAACVYISKTVSERWGV